MNFVSPLPFTEALRRFPRRGMPTPMASADLARRVEREILERAFFSSRTEILSALDRYQERITEMVSPRQERRADRVTPENPEGFVTVAPDLAQVRLEMKQLLATEGYTPDPDHAGTLRDLSSDARINLVVEHNVTEAQAYGHHLQALDADFADNFPAQELVRFEAREAQRDWPAIWSEAVAQVGDTDAAAVFQATRRMIARKDSPVWTAISDFGRPWPPFKFGSGMGLRDVSRAEAVDLGLMTRDTQIEPPRLAFNETLPPLAAFPA